MNHKYLMLNTAHVSSTENARLELGEVLKSEHNPLFWENEFPWEVRYDNGYPNVFYDDEYKIFRCYYSTFIVDDASSRIPPDQRRGLAYAVNKRTMAECYAYSEDGLTWIKPNLGLVEFHGNTNNNILKVDSHGASVFLDRHESDGTRKYKLIHKDDRVGICMSFSQDGLDWQEQIPWVKNNPAGDTHNFAFWDERSSKYVFITRDWNDGLRVVSRSESADFVNWTKPQEIYRGVGLHDQIYSMPTFIYEGVYLGLASIFRGGDRAREDWDLVDCELTYSNDNTHWDRVCRGSSMIPRGAGSYPDGEHDCGCIYASTPIIREDKISIYYMGGNGRHTSFRETGLSLATLGIDRFAGYAAKDKDESATITTGLFHMHSDDIRITCDIKQDGYVKSRITRRSWKAGKAENEILLDYDDIEAVTESATDRKLIMKSTDRTRLFAEDPDSLYRFSFEIRNAKIYSFSGDIKAFAK